MKKNIIYLFILLISFFACKKEEVIDMEHATINEIKIDSLEALYEVVVGETLTIEVELEQTSPTSDLRYYWIARSQTDEVDTIATTENLNTVIDLIPRADYYTLEFYAYDNNTNVFSRITTQLSVTTEIGYGLVVLSDLDGVANLAYVRYDGEITQDAYQKSNFGNTIGSNPIKINYSPGHPYLQARPTVVTILCQDENGIIEIDPATFLKLDDVSQRFLFPPEDMSLIKNFAPRSEAYKANVTSSWSFPKFVDGMSYGAKDFALIGNSVYQREFDAYAAPENQGLFGYPISGAQGTTGDFHKDALPEVGGKVFVFDKTQKDFAVINQGSSYSSYADFIPLYLGGSTVTGPHQFTVLRGGQGARGYGNALAYIVQNDNSNYEFLLLSPPDYGASYAFVDAYNVVSLDAFTEDSPVAFSNYFNGFFYINSSNELVYCDANTDTHTTIDNTFGALEVTAMRIEPVASRENSAEVETYRLYVATYGGSGRTGSVREYHVNITDHTDVTTIGTYENIGGRIVDMDYKFR